MLEMILFLGILGIIIGTVMAVSISTEEARIRQQSIAEVEQRSAQIIEAMTTAIHRSEAILLPESNRTGSILALQMGVNSEFPTMFTGTSTGNILLIQKTTIFPLLSTRLKADKVQFRNVNDTSIQLSFDISTVIPLVQPVLFTRHIEATATLFPDDLGQAGGCGSCPLPVCQNHLEQWYACESDTCMLSLSTFAC